MKIGELSRATGCDIETIRYYEREGLLAPPPRDASGYRQYDAARQEQLNFIRHCRSLDIPLADIRRLATSAADHSIACDEINALIDTHIGRVRSNLASLRALEQQLLALRGACAAQASDADCRIVQALVDAARGEACVCHGQHPAMDNSAANFDDHLTRPVRGDAPDTGRRTSSDVA